MGVLEQTEEKMKAAIEHLHRELRSIRTGRANPALLDSVMVEVYGTSMRLKELATVTTPEPRQLLITPFDQNNTAAVGKGIERANVGVMPVVEGNVVRINIPPMDEAMRLEMKKQCQQKREEAKVGIRGARKDGNDSIRKDKSAGDLGEDEVKGLEKKIQDLTDKYCKESETVSEEKEKEIMTV